MPIVKNQLIDFARNQRFSSLSHLRIARYSISDKAWNSFFQTIWQYSNPNSGDLTSTSGISVLLQTLFFRGRASTDFIPSLHGYD